MLKVINLVAELAVSLACKLVLILVFTLEFQKVGN